MNTENYKNCLFAKNSSSEFLKGSYNFSNRVGSVILNDLHPTGEVYFKSGNENVFYVDKLNLSLFSGDQVYTGEFTGELKPPLNLRTEKLTSPDDFSVLIDFSIEDCSKTQPTVLFSSCTGVNLSSGIIFGYNAINKWFIEYGTGENKALRTFKDFELNKKNLISFGIKNNIFNFNRYDTINNTVENVQEELENFVHSNKFIFGKSHTGYSGFSGSINHIFISENGEGVEDLNYFECAFCSGFNSGVDKVLFSQEAFDPLSVFMLDITGTGITGYENSVFYNSSLGIHQSTQILLTGNIILDSILTGSKQTGNYSVTDVTIINPGTGYSIGENLYAIGGNNPDGTQYNSIDLRALKLTISSTGANGSVNNYIISGSGNYLSGEYFSEAAPFTWQADGGTGTGFAANPNSFARNTIITQEILEQPFSIPLIDENRKKIYNNDSISIVFISNVESGDLLEIYDYNEINNNIDLSANQIFSSDLAVFSNGMLFVSGLDYSVSSNGLIEYDSDDSDEIRVNKISSPIQYLLYSGLYENYRQITGSNENAGYYPASSQFSETGDGNVTITGFDSLFFNGFKLSGYDLFMNGQKIYSGIDYATGITGGKESLIIYASNFNDAKLAITTGENGELISIDESTESILAFSPVQNQNYHKILDYRTSNVITYPLSGKSTEIWLNGIKMIKNIDYSIKLPCRYNTRDFNFEDLPYVF